MSDPEQHKDPKPRPYAHLTVDELRKVEELTDEEWFDELRARGILVPAYDGPPKNDGVPFQQLRGTLPPGALERFLKERAGIANWEEIMTSVRVPQDIDMVWPTVLAMRRLGSPAHYQVIDDLVIELGNFSEEQKALTTAGGASFIAYRAGWVRISLRDIDVVENHEPTRWRLTLAGQQISEQECLAKYRALYPTIYSQDTP